ncbi:hypothetical protein [Microcoleus sp. FACHB-831]|nr:hypothetical protein [Microcoleus sp. FACHB-831]
MKGIKRLAGAQGRENTQLTRSRTIRVLYPLARSHTALKPRKCVF